MNSNLLLELFLGVIGLLVIALNLWIGKSHPSEISYDNLRARAFTFKPENPETAVQDPDQPYGAIMEIGFPGAVVSLFCYCDGSANLYLSNGETVTSKASYSYVSDVAYNFVRQSQKYLNIMRPVDTFPLPRRRFVRFYVLTQRRIFSEEILEKRLLKSESILTYLYEDGYQVITQLGKMKRMSKRQS